MRAALAGVVLAAVLAGCAIGPRAVPDERRAAWDALRDRLEAIEGWRAEGRLSVRMGADGGQAGFTWYERRADGYRVELRGPWGQGAARLAGSDGRVELRAGGGRRFIGTDGRELLREIYGWDIPIAGLRRWLIGLPTAEASYTLDRFGRLETLTWQGWRIEYVRHRQRDGLDLPAVLEARHASRDSELRIAVDEWYPDDGSRPARPDSPVPLIGE